MDAGKPESKWQENLRYLGYAIGAFGGILIFGLVYLFLEPILEFVRSIAFLAALLAALLGIALATLYLAFFRKKE